MAGMPPSLIQRANEILEQLETMHRKETDSLPTKPSSKVQLSIFDAHTETFDTIRKLLQGIDINRLTPVEALLKLNEIKGMLR
jgi:DNA mismatch repair protein MutS